MGIRQDHPATLAGRQRLAWDLVHVRYAAQGAQIRVGWPLNVDGHQPPGWHQVISHMARGDGLRHSGISLDELGDGMTLQLGSHGPLVSRWTDVMLRRFRSYALGVDGLPLRNDGYYGNDEAKVQWEYERRTNQQQDGVVSDRDLGALGLAQPVIFTVEGHQSNMWFGPCADNARQLQQQGVAYWQPVGYESNKLPFDNPSGVRALTDLFSSTVLPDGTPFPPGTPSAGIAFSQGAMVWSDFLDQQVLPEGAPLHWRLKDLKRSLCLGNPRREFGQCVPWSPKPPPSNTGGIMVHREFVTTGTALQGRHAENCNNGDLFSVNTNDKAGWDKEAIAKIITENSWIGGPAAIFTRVLALLGNVPAEAIPAIKALISAIMFAASNPNPHYSTIAEPGDIEWMRGVAA